MTRDEQAMAEIEAEKKSNELRERELTIREQELETEMARVATMRFDAMVQANLAANDANVRPPFSEAELRHGAGVAPQHPFDVATAGKAAATKEKLAVEGDGNVVSLPHSGKEK